MGKQRKHSSRQNLMLNIILLIIFTFGSVGIYSWFVGNFILVSIVKNYVAMAQSTSIVFCTISILLLLYINIKNRRIVNSIIKTFSIIIILYAVLIIFKYFFNIRIKIENFYILKPTEVGRVLYSRMSPVTALLFILSASNILFFYFKSKTSKIFNDLFTLLIFSVTFIVLIGYLYQSPVLYGVKFIPIALPTAICFLLLCIFFSIINGFPFNVSGTNSIRYKLSITFIPLIIAIIVLQGFIDTNILHHQQDPTLLSASLVIISIIVSVFLILWNSLKMDKKLIESEDKYKSIFDNVQDVFFIVNNQGIIEDISPSIKYFTEFRREELINTSIINIYYDSQDRDKLLETIIAKGELRDYELKLKSRTGEIIYVSVNAHLNYDINGNPAQIDGAIRDIRERKKAEEALKVSLSRYQSLISNLEAGVVVHNPDTSIALNNKRASELLGLSDDQMKGKLAIDPRWMFVQEDLTPLALNEYPVNKVLNTNSPFLNFVIGAFIPEKNDIIWLNVNGTPVFNNNGEIQEVLISFLDITERKKAEEQLKLLKHSIDRHYDGAFWIDTNNKFIYVNDAACNDLGYTKDELIGMSLKEISIGANDESLKNVWQKLKTEGHINVETIHRRKDGSQYPAEIVSTYVNFNGKEYNCGFARDITIRKSTEELLFQSKNDWEDTFDTITDMITIHDKNFNIIRSNKAGKEMLKIPAVDEHVNIKCYQMYHGTNCPPDGCPSCISAKSGTPSTNEIFEPHLNRYLEIRAIPRFDANNELKGLIHVVRDISDRKKIEFDLIAEKVKAEESDKLKSAFLANMSHEIRTPMNGILGFADLLQEHDLSGEKQQEYVTIIQKSGNRMLNIINDIISISKIESGTVETYIAETNINEQLDYVYTFFKPEAEGKGMQLTYIKSLPSKDMLINTDREKFYSIITNLVKNAIKYTNEGSIEFGYILKGAFLEFYVKDTGIGVPLDRQEAIFERFIQADIENKNAIQGAGLGLSITKAYVEMLGGKIWMESKEKLGSTFYFTLPYNTNLIVENTNIKTQDNINTIEKDVKKLKVLIVEDDNTSDTLITIMLKSKCKEILHAQNGADAIELCRNNSDLDLILMDINLPIMGGYEATRKIREFNKDIIIIAQTAYALKGDDVKAIEVGCNDYITKPIKTNLLMNMINKHIN